MDSRQQTTPPIVLAGPPPPPSYIKAASPFSPVHRQCCQLLSILTQKIACKCGSPTLQAIYDQFGRIFLFWRDDPAVYDLADAAKVQEAAWRVWEAGAEPWLGDVLAEEEKQRRLRGKGWSRLSQSSLSSEESLDIEIEIVEVPMESP
ncbi:hypothetical protein B0T16DRAFT_459529 [Cercophora newfieldiana]|uniref:Uncharacterized protein n=1 Tax=Cercophora newfieldiana TaxID=92897 RepID=A0AA40CM10_9PEZI|nr:hypothetical protein B0T16DRAFT_459529 [Cercophora newfieldiana]